MLAVREHLDDLRDARGHPVEVAVVTFTTREFALRYHEHHDLPFPLLVDADRAVYRAYGLERGRVGRVWGWRAAKRYAEIIVRSGPRGLRLPREDTLQLGGDFVVDPNGRLVWGFWGEGPDDRPPVRTLIDVVGEVR